MRSSRGRSGRFKLWMTGPSGYAGVLSVLVSMAAPCVSQADIIFSDFGPGYTYSASTGFAVGAPAGVAGSFVEAAGFAPNHNYVLSEIDVAFSEISGPNGVYLSLDVDSDGVPGAAIESWTLRNLPPVASTNSVFEAVLPLFSIPLLRGDTYWIVAAPIAAGSFVTWNADGTGIGGSRLVQSSESPSGWTNVSNVFSDPAFQVLGTPEPAGLLLFATVLIGFGIFGARKLL